MTFAPGTFPEGRNFDFRVGTEKRQKWKKRRERENYDLSIIPKRFDASANEP